ncbi:MAG: thioredoxin-dependent thiol peroxidase [Saprospiraceae bacterium]|nr:thioredoxin-dependent thiol peroxidase [Saprospiraceae bacterium]
MSDLAKTHLKAGDKAPEFEGHDQDGNLHALSMYRDEKLVLFFYPKDNTPGCTAEVCNLRDHFSELKKAGFRLLGVSADSQKKHQNFIKKFSLPFPLLSDVDKNVISDFGVWGRKKFMGREFDGIIRTTFVIEKGIITKVIEKVKTSDHAKQIKG